MHITSVRLKNWGPFRGEFILDLEPIPYAVTATRDDDPERSNWGGKTHFLEAVPFAFYGEHRHRLEDGWISRGEKEGIVEILLSDGSVVRRYRAPGKGTQVEVLVPSLFTGVDAQRKIEELVGLGLEDFRTTSYFAQGATSGLVRMDPGERTAKVARWLRLEPLERCSVLVRKMGLVADKGLADVRGRIESARERLARASGPSEFDLPFELGEREKELAEWTELLAKASNEAANVLLLEAREKIIAEGRRLRAEYEAEDGLLIAKNFFNAEQERTSAQRQLDAARVKRANRVSVATGTFNGRCPVAGIECPAKDEINDLGEAAAKEARAAGDEEQEALGRVQRAQQAYREANEQAVARRSREERLKTLLERAKAMGTAQTQDGGTGLVLEAVRAERDGVFRQVQELKHRIGEAEAATAELVNLVEHERGLELEATACREAGAIFKASQRKLAEGTVGQIAREGNRMLAGAGVELSFEATWEREGKDPADDCDACGLAFPATRKAKKCAGCGEPRGPKRVQRFDVALSDVSGGAEDLVGFTLALAAGRWLRGERGSPWSVLLADEPWAQLDKSHRRTVCAYVPGLLAAAQVRQAFVISHDAPSVSSLPGRIEITRDGRWSTVSVR